MVYGNAGAQSRPLEGNLLSTIRPSNPKQESPEPVLRRVLQVGHTNKFFNLLFFSITYRLFWISSAEGRTTVESEGLPQLRAILTVKMPTEPIIIIIGSWI